MFVVEEEEFEEEEEEVASMGCTCEGQRNCGHN
jgi:hypothetical protein